MGTRATVLALAAVVATMASSLGCTDDDSGDGTDSGANVDPGAAELADRLGCDRTAPASREAWDDDESPLLCYSDEGWAATIHAPLSPAGRGAAVTLLNMRGNETFTCPDGTTLPDVVVIADEAWVVVTGGLGVDRVLDRLGGEISLGDGTGPPASYEALPCPQANP
jgi:hypothetical protein